MFNTDIMLVPQDVSFGFTVLESLSYGCPVIVGVNVGAKDLIENQKTGWILNNDIDSFLVCLENILNNPHIIEDMNLNIYDNFIVKEIESHAIDIIKEIYE